MSSNAAVATAKVMAHTSGNATLLARLTVMFALLVALVASAATLAAEQTGATMNPVRPLPGKQPPTKGMPTWPQRFEIRGPESSSFGFAVTQPGPVVVDVQWQGPPLVVALVGPNKVEQAGAGRVVLQYQVTPQDVQRGVLWSVAVTQQTPGAAPVAGEVTVRHPQADPAIFQRATQAQRLSKQQIDQANAAADAGLEQMQAARKSEFAQQITNRERADNERFRMALTQTGGANPTLIRSRGLDESAPAAEGAAGTSDGVTSRAIPPQGASGQRVIAQRPQPGEAIMRPIQTTPPPPAPFQITSLSENSGGPKKGIAIYGTSFGSNPGLVWITIPPGVVPPCDANCQAVARFNGLPQQHEAQLATVTSWSDTTIIAELPDLTRVLPYQAEIFVGRNSQLSNRLPFSFIPRQELRFIRAVPGDRRHSSTVLTIPMSLPPNMHHQRTFNIPLGEFAGEKGDDEFFLRTQLQNGWTVSAVRVYPLASGVGNVPTEVNSVMSLMGGAYVQQQGSGTNPYFNVRWWLNPFQAAMWYRISVEIVGPAGVPDGVVAL